VLSAGVDATVGQNALFVHAGSFTDPGPDSPWTWTVHYGDGSATSSLTLNADHTFSLNHAFAASGDYTVTVRDQVLHDGQRSARPYNHPGLALAARLGGEFVLQPLGLGVGHEVTVHS